MQEVANQKQSRGSHAKQGSVIHNNTATAVATVCLLTVLNIL